MKIFSRYKFISHIIISVDILYINSLKYGTNIIYFVIMFLYLISFYLYLFDIDLCHIK